jgi:hypothetical protein
MTARPTVVLHERLFRTLFSQQVSRLLEPLFDPATEREKE